MDETFAKLERRVQTGDRDAFAPYKQARTRIGLFTPERIEDPALGDAFIYHNLRVDNLATNIVQGNNPRTAFHYSCLLERRTKAPFMTSAKLEAAIKISWFDLRSIAAFSDDLQYFKKTQQTRLHDWPVFGKLDYAESWHSWLSRRATGEATLTEQDICGRTIRRIIAVPYVATLEENTSSSAAATFIEDLFCVESAKLIAAFQYFCSDDFGVQVWTPDRRSRRRHPESVFMLGEDFGLGAFVVNCRGAQGPIIPWRHYEAR